MKDQNVKPMYVGVELSEQMHKENPKLLVIAGKINRIYYDEACGRR